MNRRKFFGVFSFLAALLGIGGAAKAGLSITYDQSPGNDTFAITDGTTVNYGAPVVIPLDTNYKRVFRHDGVGWKEIAWEMMRKGDTVVMIGAPLQGYLDLELWTLASDPDVGLQNAPVVLKTNVPMLPIVVGPDKGCWQTYALARPA